MQTQDHTDPAAAATLAELSRLRTRLLRELQQARDGPAQAAVDRLGAELREIEGRMTLLIGTDRRAGPFEPRLRLPTPAQG